MPAPAAAGESMAIFIILYLSDLRAFDSFNLSLTLISSGGFLPVNNLELIINNYNQILHDELGHLHQLALLDQLLIPWIAFEDIHHESFDRILVEEMWNKLQERV